MTDEPHEHGIILRDKMALLLHLMHNALRGCDRENVDQCDRRQAHERTAD